MSLNTFFIVQKHFQERTSVKCRTLKKIILNVAEHFLHHRTTSYRALYTNNYTFGIFFIIFYLTINRKYNIIIYARRIFCSRPATNKAETQQRFHNSSLIQEKAVMEAKKENLFSRRVKDLMKKNRYSQKKLCEICGITEAAFSRYMTSGRMPRTDVLASRILSWS